MKECYVDQESVIFDVLFNTNLFSREQCRTWSSGLYSPASQAGEDWVGVAFRHNAISVVNLTSDLAGHHSTSGTGVTGSRLRN